jgi:hypothetical protein
MNERMNLPQLQVSLRCEVQDILGMIEPRTLAFG